MNFQEAKSVRDFITSKVEEAWEVRERDKIYREYGEEVFDAMDVVPDYLETLHDESPPIVKAVLEEIVSPPHESTYEVRITLSPSAHVCGSLIKCQLKECCSDWCFKPVINKNGLKMKELREVDKNTKDRTIVIYT